MHRQSFTSNYLLDEHRRPVRCMDDIEHGLFIEGPGREARCRVDKTEIAHPEHPERKILVSTVFTGTARNFILEEDTPPEVFETRVLLDSDDLERFERHYTTWDAAAEGHLEVVQEVNQQRDCIFAELDPGPAT